jgi:hypothetical protein
VDTNPITIDVDNKLYNTINFLATNVGMDTNEKTAIVSIYYVGDPIPVVATNINHIKSFRLYNTPTPPVYQTGEAFVGQLQARNVSGGWYPGSLYKYTISPDSTRVVDKITVDCANAAVFAATTVGLSANENSFEYLTNGMNFDSLDLLPGTTISSTSIIRLADYGSNPNIYVGIYNQANKLCYLRVATLDNLSVGALTTISFSPITLEATQGSSFSAKTFILNDNLVPLATSFTHGNAKPVIFLAGDSTCRQSLVSELPYKGWGTDFGTFFNSKVTVSNRAKGGYTTKMFINEGYLTSIINSGKPGDFLFVQN